jgi:hypothetical protein
VRTSFPTIIRPLLTNHSNHRIFFYLSGHTQHFANLPGPVNATLELHINPPDHDIHDDDFYFAKAKIAGFGLLTVRRDGDEADNLMKYGGPLRAGDNEMVGDLFMYDLDPQPGVYVWDVEVVARLMGGRLLWAFAARVEIEE